MFRWLNFSRGVSERAYVLLSFGDTVEFNPWTSEPPHKSYAKLWREFSHQHCTPSCGHPAPGWSAVGNALYDASGRRTRRRGPTRRERTTRRAECCLREGGGGGGRVLLKRGGGAECCLRHCTTRRTVSYKASGPDASGMYDASYCVVQGVGARRVGDVRRVGRCRGPTRRKIPISTVVPGWGSREPTTTSVGAFLPVDDAKPNRRFCMQHALNHRPYWDLCGTCVMHETSNFHRRPCMQGTLT